MGKSIADGLWRYRASRDGVPSRSQTAGSIDLISLYRIIEVDNTARTKKEKKGGPDAGKGVSSKPTEFSVRPNCRDGFLTSQLVSKYLQEPLPTCTHCIARAPSAITLTITLISLV